MSVQAMLSNTTARFEELKQQATTAVGSLPNAKEVNTAKVAIEVSLRHPTDINVVIKKITFRISTNLYY